MALGCLLAALQATAGRAALAGEQGALIIVGGALSAENEAIYRNFVDRMGSANGRVAVIAAASGAPVESGLALADTLERYGVDRGRVDLVKLATVDDDTTPDVNEAEWSGNSDSVEEIAKISNAAAIWFTGGDQVRLAETLLKPDGGDTPMLGAIRQRLSDGAVIAGTSAGAAIMSRVMIARGDSLTALTQAPAKSGDPLGKTGEALVLTRGLGFLPLGIADQHFDRRARLGRLARALAEADPKDRTGFGIDEDTALIVDLASGRASVAGAGSVIYLDGRDAESSQSKGRHSVSGLRVSVLTDGDEISLVTWHIEPAAYKTPIRGQTLNDHVPPSGGGMAVAAPDLETTLSLDLVDNSQTDALSRISLAESGVGFRYRFEKVPATEGYRGKASDGRTRYTIVNVGFDIEQIDFEIRPAP